MLAVSITSGIRMRVNRKRPKQVEMQRPAKNPATGTKGPSPERGCYPGQRDGRQHDRDTGGPIAYSEKPVGFRDQPAR